MELRSAFSALVMILAISPFQAESQQTVESPKVKDLTGNLDLSVPQSPAFTILGVTPEKTTDSDSLRDLSLGLLHGLDPRGNLQSGVAIDTRPYLLIAGRSSTLSDYRSSPAIRFLSRTQLSFATASGQSDDDKADRIALGLRVVLWMEQDPALGSAPLEYVPRDKTAHSNELTADGKVPESKGTLDGCYKEYLTQLPVPESLPETTAGLDGAAAALADAARSAIAGCLEPFKERYWNAGNAEIGVAGYESDVEGFDEDGFGAWLGISHSLGHRGQIVLRGAYADNLLVPDSEADGGYRALDETNLGMRVKLGSKRGSVMAEALWTRGETDDGTDEYTRASIGVEFEAARDIWLQFAVGQAFDTDLFDDDPVYSGQVRFGFSEKSLLSTAD